MVIVSTLIGDKGVWLADWLVLWLAVLFYLPLTKIGLVARSPINPQHLLFRAYDSESGDAATSFQLRKIAQVSYPKRILWRLKFQIFSLHYYEVKFVV